MPRKGKTNPSSINSRKTRRMTLIIGGNSEKSQREFKERSQSSQDIALHLMTTMSIDVPSLTTVTATDLFLIKMDTIHMKRKTHGDAIPRDSMMMRVQRGDTPSRFLIRTLILILKKVPSHTASDLIILLGLHSQDMVITITITCLLERDHSEMVLLDT